MVMRAFGRFGAVASLTDWPRVTGRTGRARFARRAQIGKVDLAHLRLAGMRSARAGSVTDAMKRWQRTLLSAGFRVRAPRRRSGKRRSPHRAMNNWVCSASNFRAFLSAPIP